MKLIASVIGYTMLAVLAFTIMAAIASVACHEVSWRVLAGLAGGVAYVACMIVLLAWGESKPTPKPPVAYVLGDDEWEEIDE